MGEEKTKKVLWEVKDEVLKADEFLHEAVPLHLRRTTWSQVWVWIGFGFMVTGLIVGGSFAGGAGLGALPPMQAILASAVGMAILFWMTSSLGIAAQKSGFNLALLATNAYGYKGRALPMGIMGILTLGWFASITGMVGDLWGLAIGNPSGIVVLNPADFGQPWVAPVTIELFFVIAVFGVIFTINALRGINAIELVARWTSPIMFFAAFIVAGIHLKNAGGFNVFWDAGNEMVDEVGLMSFGTAITMVVGSWVAGCIMGADLYRFNKNARSVLLCAGACFLLTNPVLHAVGYIGHVTIGNLNYFTWIFHLGGVFAVIAVVGWTISLWTTNNAELYCHTIYASSVLKAIKVKVSRNKLMVIMGSIGTVAAATAFYQMFYVDFITVLGSVAPPVAGPIIADFFLCRKEKYRQELLDKHPNFRVCGMVALIVGGVLGYLFQFRIAVPFDLPSGILALLISIALYVILYKFIAPDRKIDDELIASLEK